MIWKVKYTHSGKTHHKSNYFIRKGTEVYRHPKNYFVVLEFEGKMGSFRESFYPNELMEV